MPVVPGIINVALLRVFSQRPRRPGQFQIWALLTAYVFALAFSISIEKKESTLEEYLSKTIFSMEKYHNTMLGNAIEIVAVLLLGLRPRRIAILAGTFCGRILLSLAKVFSTVWLATVLAMDMWPSLLKTWIYYVGRTSLAPLVLSPGSLQTPATSDLLVAHWIDAILRICFVWVTVFPLPRHYLALDPDSKLSRLAITCLSLLTLLLMLFTGNMQFPTAVVQVIISSYLFFFLIVYFDDYGYPELSTADIQWLVPSALLIFYFLALCQGLLYVIASILQIVSFFPADHLSVSQNFVVSGELKPSIFTTSVPIQCSWRLVWLLE